jgi:hypothetical protein
MISKYTSLFGEGGIFLMFLGLAACATVDMQTERFGPAGIVYQKTVVLSVSPTPEGRRLLEGAAQEALFAYQEAPGRSVDAAETVPPAEQLVAVLKSAGYDSVLIIYRQSVIRVGDGAKPDWRAALEPSAPGPLNISSIEGAPEERSKPTALTAIEPQYEPVGRRYVKGGAWLVDLTTGKAVWSAQGTLNVDAYARSAGAAQSAAKGLVKKLAQDGLLSRPR